MARTIRYESEKEKEKDKGIKQSIKRQRKQVKNLLSKQIFNSFEAETYFEDYRL